jgi:chromate transport protein ChrA
VVESEHMTADDFRADAKRHFRWKYVLPSGVWMIVLLQAIERLQDPTLVGTPRTLWIVVPALLFIPAYWAWAAAERLQDEMNRAINGRAAIVAFRFTLFWLFALALLDAAVGLPHMVPGPFGLPDETFGWFEAGFVPMFFWMFAWIRERRRVLPQP